MRRFLVFLACLFLFGLIIIFGGEMLSLNGTIGEKLVEFLVHPIVITILLTLASLGIVLELFSTGFGISGMIGLLSLVLFFYGHLMAGLAGYETIILFLIGMVLLILEHFVPGGILGGLGIVSIIASFLLAADNIVYMGFAILIAIGVSIVASILMIRVFGKSMMIFNKIILTDSTNTEGGYVSNPNRTDLLGKMGTTVTPLRPAGTITIDSERLDVVSEGEFILKGKQVKVVKVEGPRIVVRELNK